MIDRPGGRAAPTRLAEAVAVCETFRVPAPGGTYDLRRYAFGEFGTQLPAALVAEIVDGLAAGVARLSDGGAVVCPEPGGNQWGLAVGYRTGRDVVVLRQSAPAGTPGARIARRTAFYQGELHVPAIAVDDAPVVIVDDVISSGGTLDAILTHLTAEGVEVAGVQAILARGDGPRHVAERHGVPIRCLAVDERPRRY